ncbi:MAG: PfkB family carbohydrate kinase, partial [Micropruina sp.]
MIVTLTANPGLDRTETLEEPLTRGAVHRVTGVTVEPGGKGVNVARAIHYAGVPVRALLPAGLGDPMLTALDEIGLAYRAVTVEGRVRTNITLTEPDGTTTKLNEPGPRFTPANLDELAALVLSEAAGASWAVLSGSLPPGVPTGWYADLVRQIRPLGCLVAVDTSDAPLLALAEQFPGAAPDLLKPNSEELAQLTGAEAHELEAAAKAGDPSAALTAARSLV